MARDRKRAKQRRDRRGSSAAGRARESAPAVLPGQPADQGPAADAPAILPTKPAGVDAPAGLERSNGDAEPSTPPSPRGPQTLPPRPRRSPKAKSSPRPSSRATSVGTNCKSPAARRDPEGPGVVGRGPGAAVPTVAMVASAPSRPRVLPCGAATGRSASCAPAGPSCSACSGPTAVRSRRRRPSCWASWPSPALIWAWPTTWPRKSSNSSSEA